MYEEFCLLVCDAVRSGRERRREDVVIHQFASTKLQARYSK
jgi:hypothetical protein